jgi:L-aminopeptidase/D-esterase-like protein
MLRGASARSSFENTAMQNTTLVVVACSAPLGAVELTQVATAAGAGLYRRITPVATSFDGDVVFAVSPIAGERPSTELLVIETLAAAAVEHAIERAVRAAHGRDGIPGLADTHGN